MPQNANWSENQMLPWTFSDAITHFEIPYTKKAKSDRKKQSD